MNDNQLLDVTTLFSGNEDIKRQGSLTYIVCKNNISEGVIHPRNIDTNMEIGKLHSGTGSWRHIARYRETI